MKGRYALPISRKRSGSFTILPFISMKKIDLFASESVKTSLIEACENFKELEAIIVECEPWVSHSRPDPVIWSAKQLIERINAVKLG